MIAAIPDPVRIAATMATVQRSRMRNLVSPYPVEAFFEEIRAADQGRSAHIPAPSVLAIAGDAALRLRFRQAFHQINDPDMKLTILEYLRNLIGDLETASDRTDIKVDLLDRAGMTPSASVVATGIVALVSATTVAPFVLAAGLIGVIACGIGRTLLRSNVQQNKASIRRVQLLLKMCEG